MTTERPYNFALRVREMRKKSGLSLRELADRLGVTAGAVWFWEQGRNQPSLTTIVAIAAHAGCDPAFIFHRDEEPSE